MKQPILMAALKARGQLLVAKRDLRDAERSLAAMAKSQRVLAERVTAVAGERDGWKARAMSLYAAVPADVRDEVLKTHAWIDSFPVVEGPRSAP